MNRRVLNVFPAMTSESGERIALVGEAPGEDEEIYLTPFVGYSGKLLDGLLSSAKIIRRTCFVGNVYQYRPPGNKIEVVDRGCPQWLESITQLQEDLVKFNPTVICALGETAMHLLTGKTGITKYRGSILPCTFVPGLKVVPTIHPAAVLRVYTWYKVVKFDLDRVKEESASSALNLPERTFTIVQTLPEALAVMERLRSVPRFSFDIETNMKGHLVCIGFSDHPSRAWTIPLDMRWTGVEYLTIMQSLEALMQSPAQKIAQNAQFDMTCLAWHYGIVVRNLWMDTMLAHHACFPEFRKSLAFQCSLYTREPYYKDEGKEDGSEKEWGAKLLSQDESKNKLFIYNCKDAAVTFECAEKLDVLLDKLSARAGYTLDMNLLEVAMFMTVRGALVDQARCTAKITEIDGWIANLNETCEKVFGRPVNVKSPRDMKALLYDELKLPPVYNAEKKLTTNADALIKLTQKTGNPTIKLLLKIRQFRTHQAFFSPGVYSDGRMHASSNIAGTENARWSSSASILGGRNFMNIPSGDQPPHINCRDIYIADPGMIMVGWDKKGAEACVVSYKAWLITGDASYKNVIDSGEKIHVWLMRRLIRRGICPLSEEQLNAELRLPDDQRSFTFKIWYYISKKAIHAFSYGMGYLKFCNVCAEETDGEVIVEPYVSKQVRGVIYEELSSIPKWQIAVQTLMRTQRHMLTAFGRIRYFFERMGDDLFGEAYAFEPQATVADDVARALRRTYDELPSVEPLQQNYDSILCQCPIEQKDEVLPKMKLIAEQPFTLTSFDGSQSVRLTIPVSLKAGRSWGEMEEVKL